MAKAPVNPFAAAAKKGSSTLKSKSPIYVAKDCKDFVTGKLTYSRDEVANALENVAEGVKMIALGDAMKEQNRPIVEVFATTNFVQDWVLAGSRPENPKVVQNEIGDGYHCQVSFVDSAKKLDDNQFGKLANLIGAEKAEESVERRHDFTINPDLLGDEVNVKKDGKVVKQNVMEAITEALQDRFGPSPEILGSLFVAKEVFTTKKGLIDRGIQLVTTGKTTADMARMAQFLDAIRATISLKPGGSPSSPTAA